MKLVEKYIILCFLVCLNLGVFAQNTPKLVFPKTGTDPVTLYFQKDNLKIDSQNLQHWLKVFVENKNQEYPNQLAIQGSYKVENNIIIFTPDFPFMEGQTYIVRTSNSDRNSAKFNYQDTSFFIPKKNKIPDARILKIYPSSEIIPENTLRFYIYFSTPMKREVALQHIRLIDENGKEDSHAFMKFKRELWSPDGKRLTLLFDPGRIKRGVSGNVEKGAALLVNKNYKLIISSTWTDVYNQTLRTSFAKPIAVSSAYRINIKTKDWEINSPKIASKESLVIKFDRIFDHALLQKMIVVKDENDEIINGEITISEYEKKWSFTPELIWKNTTIFIQVDSRLEDISGNNLQDLLDHTVEQGSKTTRIVRLPIRLKPK